MSKSTRPKAMAFAPCTDPAGHFWQLPTPNGKTAVGVCSRCGEAREHVNYFRSTVWTRTAQGQG